MTANRDNIIRNELTEENNETMKDLQSQIIDNLLSDGEKHSKV